MAHTPRHLQVRLHIRNCAVSLRFDFHNNTSHPLHCEESLFMGKVLACSGVKGSFQLYVLKALELEKVHEGVRSNCEMSLWERGL